MTLASKAQGTVLGVDDGAGGYTQIAELRSIESTIEADELDASNHDTPNAWREWISGMKQGELTIEGNYLPANTTQNATGSGVLNLFQTGTIVGMQLQFTNTAQTTWTFSGFVREFSPQAPVDEILTFNSAIRIVGQPTLA